MELPRLEVARGSQSGSRPAAASSPSETLVFRIAGRNQQCRAPVSADAGSPEGANCRGAVRVLLCRKGAVLVLAEPEARPSDRARDLQRGQRGATRSARCTRQRGDYGHVVGVPALVAFCGVGRLPLTGARGSPGSWRSLRRSQADKQSLLLVPEVRPNAGVHPDCPGKGRRRLAVALKGSRASLRSPGRSMPTRWR